MFFNFLVRPEPPKNITYTFMPLVIYWNWNNCGSVGPLDNKCQVQYRARDHMLDWIQVRGGMENPI